MSLPTCIWLLTLRHSDVTWSSRSPRLHFIVTVYNLTLCFRPQSRYHTITIPIASNRSNASIIKTYTANPWLNTTCALGEAPHWDRETNTLRFVDILSKTLHTVNLTAGTSSHRIYPLDISIGCTAEIAGQPDAFVFGGKHGYGVFHKETGAYSWVKKFDLGHGSTEAGDGAGDGAGAGADVRAEVQTQDPAARQRSNDGIVDAAGRFLVGTMTDRETDAVPRNEGQIFSLSGSTLSRVFGPVTIPNGISFSSDNRSIYLTDSSTSQIRKYPYDLSTGAIDASAAEVFLDTSTAGKDLGGVPDGHCRDAEGCFWVAIYGGSAVYRVSEAGEVVAKVDVPTRNVTCCAIADGVLYITTAAEEEPERFPESAEVAGGVFRVEVGVEGAELHRFRM